MTPEELILQAERIREAARHSPSVSALVEAREFFRVHTGAKSLFLKQLNEVDHTWSDDYVEQLVTATLDGFIRYVRSGLLEGTSIERKAKMDVVSDFLSQADTLLSTPKVHPAAPTVIIGAALEEFLRTWHEEAGLNLGTKRPGLEAYATALREADLITKQDAKDITSWGGLRNHAAHGEWKEVEDKARISLMLEGVNLFMRKYEKQGA